MVLVLVFIVFNIVYMFIKFTCTKGIFIHLSINICIKFFWVSLLGFCIFFMFDCLFFLVFALLLCVFLNILHASYLFTNFNDYNLLLGYVYVQAQANTGKDADYLQSNNNTSKDLWILFSVSLFLKVLFNKSGEIKFWMFSCLSALFFTHAH